MVYFGVLDRPIFIHIYVYTNALWACVNIHHYDVICELKSYEINTIESTYLQNKQQNAP